MFKKKKNRALNLTPLIDVMTTLIIFILIQSSDSPVEVKNSIQLSKGQNGQAAKENSILTIGLKEITLDKDFKIEIDKGKIPSKLSHKKESKLIKNLYKKITSLVQESEKKSIDMNLSFDKRVPADSVKKIIYTVTMAGVNNIYYIGEKK